MCFCVIDEKHLFRNATTTKSDAEESSVPYKDFFVAFNRSNTTVERLGVARNALPVNNRISIVMDYEKELFGPAFPDLYPYRRGNPGTYRGIKLSIEACIRHYARLSHTRFSQHPKFLFMAFDILAKKRVAVSTCIRTRVRLGDFKRPCDFNEIKQSRNLNSVTEGNLAIALSTQKQFQSGSAANFSKPFAYHILTCGDLQNKNKLVEGKDFAWMHS